MIPGLSHPPLLLSSALQVPFFSVFPQAEKNIGKS